MIAARLPQLGRPRGTALALAGGLALWVLIVGAAAVGIYLTRFLT